MFRPEPFRTGGQQEEGLDGVGKIKGASLITRLKDMANQGQPSDQADRNVQDDTHVMIGPSLSIVRRQPWMWKFSCACLCLCSVTVFALVPVVVFALSLSIYCLTYRETSLDMEVWLSSVFVC